MNKILLSIALSTILFSETVIVPDDYLISEDEEVSYVYSKEYSEILPELKNYQQTVIKQYEDEFGYKLDDTLFVGLASQNNQIANGFSTQIPFNSQLFYGAGAGYIDYFCFNSWLKTLLIHETAHNFQLNPKESKASWLSHKIVGNTPISFLGIFPFFPIPNMMENSFLLEGNAVMNESRFDNGGRLYSGYALAEVVALALAEEIKPELMYNETLEFPYGEKHYLVGGFFQQFLAQKYGAKKVNQYFKLKSKQLFPFFTSSAFKNLFGKTFKTLLAEFVADIKTKHANYQTTKGTVVAQSQLFVPMNVAGDEIYTLIGDYLTSPKILKFNKQTKKLSFQEGAFRTGEPFKVEEEYYTQSSAKVSPTKISMGLLDSSAYIKEGTESKIIQGYLPDGKAVYFNIEKSLENPHIYIDGKFYDQSHSSVFVHGTDLYYFKQNGQTRTLYKNKKPLFNYQGHYGFVSDIDDEGNIYFIGATQHGSTAYRYNGSNTQRVTAGDDVIEFKLINHSEALVATIDAEGFKYQVVNMTPKSAEVASFDYALEDKSSKVTQSSQPFKLSSSKLEAEDYHPLTQLRYSSLEQAMGYNSDDDEFIINLQANFVDPTMQNVMSAMLSHDDERTVAGLGYNNQAHQLEFGGAIYGVEHSSDYNSTDERDHGYSAYLELPLLATGYWRVSTSLDYTKEYDSIYRKPLTLSLDILNHKQFGFSKYPNHLNSFSIFGSKDRDNNSFGATYNWIHDLGWQSYIGANATYIESDNIQPSLERGIEISDDWDLFQEDKTQIAMPTIDETLYAKKAKVGEVSLYKVLDTPLYFFSFPISLQRETLYAKHKIYDIELTNENRQYNETTIGVESDFVFFNNFPIPIKFEWLYNEDVEDKTLFRVMLGGEF